MTRPYSQRAAGWRLVVEHDPERLSFNRVSDLGFPPSATEDFMVARGKAMFEICDPVSVTLFRRSPDAWQPTHNWNRNTNA